MLNSKIPLWIRAIKHAQCDNQKPILNSNLLKEYVDGLQEICEVESLLSETDKNTEHGMFETLHEEISVLRDNLATKVQKTLMLLSILGDRETIPNTNCANVEIRAGVGGQEAMLFCAELLCMYQNVATQNRWTIDHVSTDASDIGGFRHVNFTIKGNDVLPLIALDAGVHRIQRVPITEKSGRMHTSTAAVAVLPVDETKEISILEKDIRMWTFASRGPGGQHANKTCSGVRILHIPSGITVIRSGHRLQSKNKEDAIDSLKASLTERLASEVMTDQQDKRKNQIGTLNRSEKIRTYNYVQDRVTDHRLPYTVHCIPSYLNGEVPYTRIVESALICTIDNWIKSLTHVNRPS